MVKMEGRGCVQRLRWPWVQTGRGVRRRKAALAAGGCVLTIVALLLLLGSQQAWDCGAASGERARSVALREPARDALSPQRISVDLVPPKHTYECFPDVDVDGYDYGHVRKHSMEELQRVCDATPHCAGFNSNGWLKTSTAKRVPGAADLCVKRRVSGWSARLASLHTPAHEHAHAQKTKRGATDEEQARAARQDGEQPTGTREQAGASDLQREHNVSGVDADVGDVLARMLAGRIRVFTYRLPEHLRLPPIGDYKYAAEERFAQLLRASVYSTDVGEEADAFFVRIACAEARFTARDRAAGQKAADAHALAVLSHIIHAYPFWNRTLGRDHFFVCGHDMGAAPRTAAARVIPSARNMIALVNTADVTEPDYVVHKDISLPPHVGDGCPTCIQGGFDLLRAFQGEVAKVAATAKDGDGGGEEEGRGGVDEEEQRRRHRGRGARPPALGAAAAAAAAPQAEAEPLLRVWEGAWRVVGGDRPLLGFVAGNMARGRVRPMLRSALARDPDVVVVDGYMDQREYVRHLLRSKYCLLPRGHRAWSPRVMDAVWAGCVPVLISDQYDLPLQRWLDWNVLALQIPEAEAPNAKAWLEADAHTMYEQRATYLVSVQHRLTWQASSLCCSTGQKRHPTPRQAQHFRAQPHPLLNIHNSHVSAFDLLLLELSLRMSHFPMA